MDDSFQFIIESPQHSQGHKKRPRLVTSCDNCRLKKIKCLQPSPETKCEACKAAKIPCRFRDRERYFAERSRAIAGPNSGLYATELRSEPTAALDVASGSSSPSMSSQSDPRSNSHSPKVLADNDSARYPYSERYVSAMSHNKHTHQPSFDSSRSNNGLHYSYSGQTPAQLLHYPTSSRPNSYQPDQRSVQLFDPENPQRPNPSLMTHYINVFFEQHGPEFPFLSYQDISTDFWDQRLSSILANCIAAMASQFSSLPELSIRGLHNVSESYIDVAKNLLPSVAHLPSMETLHSIILLSWFEHSHHRLPGFRTFCAMAFKMSTDLGLQDATSIEICLGEYERHRRRTTMAAIMHLHMTYNSARVLPRAFLSFRKVRDTAEFDVLFNSSSEGVGRVRDAAARELTQPVSTSRKFRPLKSTVMTSTLDLKYDQIVLKCQSLNRDVPKCELSEVIINSNHVVMLGNGKPAGCNILPF